MLSVRRGDTMIEVLFAITIFSVVAIGGLSVMNQGIATAQRSLEISLVRYEIDAQADTLRSLYNQAILEKTRLDTTDSLSPNSAIGRWNSILNKRLNASTTAPTPITSLVSEDGVSCTFPSSSNNPFAVNSMKLSLVDIYKDIPTISQPETYAKIVYSGQNIIQIDGLWIEAIKGEPFKKVPGYTDFYIRACWSTPGQSPPAIISTVVRLYEPNS